MEVPGSLLWDESLGIGFFPCNTRGEYGLDYWSRYQGMSETEMATKLNGARVRLVNQYTFGPVIDVGIGDGAFIRARGKDTFGSDVNPYAVIWLKERGLLRDPYEDEIESLTFWDSLEHIVDVALLVERTKKFCFVSIPIFQDRAHVLRSKHFRKTEHFWYFTKSGLECWFADLGFDCVQYNTIETDLGREDIGTFVFKRRE